MIYFTNEKKKPFNEEVFFVYILHFLPHRLFICMGITSEIPRCITFPPEIPHLLHFFVLSLLTSFPMSLISSFTLFLIILSIFSHLWPSVLAGRQIWRCHLLFPEVFGDALSLPPCLPVALFCHFSHHSVVFILFEKNNILYSGIL